VIEGTLPGAAMPKPLARTAPASNVGTLALDLGHSMTPPIGSKDVAPGHRLYEIVSELAILLDAFTLAGEVVFEIPHRKAFIGDHVSLESKQFPVLVRMPVGAPIYAALTMPDQQPTYQVTFAPYQPMPAAAPTTAALANLFQWAFSALLVLFYERNRPWIQATFGNETNNWPDLWRFAWTMRNAATHHAGKFNMHDETRPSVVWNDLSYNHRNHGQQILGKDLSVADILILLFEMSDDLDARGAPL
jgi:hypothetical protein